MVARSKVAAMEGVRNGQILSYIWKESWLESLSGLDGEGGGWESGKS